MDFRSDDEKRMDEMEGRILILEDALKLLITNCSCTAAERGSGHHVDCPIPHVRDLLEPMEPDEIDSERARGSIPGDGL